MRSPWVLGHVHTHRGAIVNSSGLPNGQGIMRRNIISDATRCAGCLSCMLYCSFRFEGKFRFSASKIRVKRLVNQPTEFEVVFTRDCDGCGLCADYCPYNALTRQKVEEM